MSHEIRTPVNGIVGMNEMLADSGLDATQQEYAQVIETSAEILLTVIDDVLDFSRIEAGQLEIEDIAFDPVDQVERVVKALRLPADTKGLVLDADLGADLPRLVHGDPTRLRQVLTNLLNNAIKFTEVGSVGIRVTRPDPLERPGLMRFEVTDTGIGIERDRCAQLFEAFVQADSSTTRRYGGTGLGLSIARQLVELMDGVIGVDSEPRVGSCFWFEIPFRLADEPAERPGTRVRQPALAVGDRRGRVLVAEDDEVNQKVVRAMLEGLGVEVVLAHDGAGAVEIRRERAVDLILMDCQMPVVDGLEATAAIRREEHDLGLDAVPIVAVTANAVEGARERCLAAGMDDHLTKPIRRDDMRRTLERWLPAPAT